MVQTNQSRLVGRLFCAYMVHMDTADPTTRGRLVATAARLFRQKGYNGVGLTEILVQARAPKGSLYHHFPNGKSDLAHAAADATSQGMIIIMDDAFRTAPDYPAGAATLCHKLAKLFDITHGSDTCPISAMLFDGPETNDFRDHADRIFRDWTASIAAHAVRLGTPPDRAPDDAEMLLIAIGGGWTLSRARGCADILRRVPQRLFA
jgi:TetR/AcrR family transcriptional regulator, lmrAB and yxaGH operons repressor